MAEIRRTMSQMTQELYDSLLLLKEAVAEEIPESPGKLKEIQTLSQEIRRRGDCVGLKTLAVTGKDLIEAGMRPGKELGEMLQSLLNLVLEHPEMNQKELLLRQLKL